MMNGTGTGISRLKPVSVRRQIKDYCARCVVGTRKGESRLGRTLKCNTSIKYIVIWNRNSSVGILTRLQAGRARNRAGWISTVLPVSINAVMSAEI
jgi:hypothetical protein